MLNKNGLFEEVVRSHASVKNPAMRKARALLMKHMGVDALEKVWTALSRYVQSQLDHGKGVNVVGFGKFGLNKASRNKKAFMVCENYMKSYDIVLANREPIVFGSAMLEVNFVALSMETQFPKEEVRAMLNELFTCIGQTLQSGKQPVVIEFGSIGTFYGDHRKVQFMFDGEGGNKDRLFHASGGTSIPVENPEQAETLSVTGSETGSIASSYHSMGSSCSRGSFASRHSHVSRMSLARQRNNINGIRVPPLNLLKNDKALSGSAIEEDDEFDDHKSVGSTKSNGSKRSSSEHDDGTAPLIFPAYLHKSDVKGSSATKNRDIHVRLEKRNQFVEKNMEKAFERLEEEIQKELERIKQEEDEIQNRNEKSEMQYKQLRLQKKREQLEMNAFLLEQAKERRDRERAEREAIRFGGTIIEEGENCKAFPVDAEPDYAGAHRSQKKLERALKEQMKEKARKYKEERAHNVAEERFLMDCNKRIMQEERDQRRKKKVEAKNELQCHWNRQRKVAEMQKLLTEAKNGRLLTHTMSEDGLLTVRSAMNSRR